MVGSGRYTLVRYLGARFFLALRFGAHFTMPRLPRHVIHVIHVILNIRFRGRKIS
jgi:hypothetical protein